MNEKAWRMAVIAYGVCVFAVIVYAIVWELS